MSEGCPGQGSWKNNFLSSARVVNVKDVLNKNLEKKNDQEKSVAKIRRPEQDLWILKLYLNLPAIYNNEVFNYIL